MARQLKPQVVDEVSSPNGLVTVPVYFDRNKKDFFVEVTGLDDQVRADSVTEVKQLAREMLKKAVSYKWEGIIVLDLGESWDEKYGKPGYYSYRGAHRQGAQIEFDFSRVEQSPHPTRPDDHVYRKHTIDFEAGKPDKFARNQRETNADVKGGYGIGEKAVVMPYDEEVWQGLLAMKRAVDEAHAKLAALAKRKDFAAKLRLAGKQPPIPILPEAVGERRR